MIDNEKTHDEIRNYKLFKIQQLRTREHEFSILTKDLEALNKKQYIHLAVCAIGIFTVIYLIYATVKSMLDSAYFDISKKYIIIAFILCVIISCFLGFQLIRLVIALQKHLKTASAAVQYFTNETDKARLDYENYVENYLQKHKSRFN